MRTRTGRRDNDKVMKGLSEDQSIWNIAGSNSPAILQGRRIAMRILLFYPDTEPLSITPNRLMNIEPLGLEYVAGALSDHEVAICDMKCESHWIEMLAEFQPDIVGITGTVIHTNRILTVLSTAKSLNPRLLTIVGGTHATLVPMDFATPAVDVVIPGQGVDAIREVVERVETSRPLSSVPGIYLQGAKGLRFTGCRTPLKNLDTLPMPRRDLTARYRKGYFHLVWRPTALIVTSVGCPHGCNFCPCPVLTGRRVLRRSPHLVVEELKQITEPYIYAGDDNIFFDYHHAMTICAEIRAAQLHKQYYVLSRVDEIVKHPDLVERWAEIGLKKVFLGLESFSDDDLRSLSKSSSVARNNRAIEILQANKVDPMGAFIIQPTYVKADFDNLLRYMDRMKIFYNEFTILTPFPGTDFYERVKDEITSDDRRVFDLAHAVLPTTLPLNEFYSLYSRLYRRANAVRRAVKIRPTVSPFTRLRFVRLLPGLWALFTSSRRAYQMLKQSETEKAKGAKKIQAPVTSA